MRKDLVTVTHRAFKFQKVKVEQRMEMLSKKKNLIKRDKFNVHMSNISVLHRDVGTTTLDPENSCMLVFVLRAMH